MKLRWPTRYERTRAILAFAFVAFVWMRPTNPDLDVAGTVCGVICGVGFLIAGLLKPLHDDASEGDA